MEFESANTLTLYGGGRNNSVALLCGRGRRRRQNAPESSESGLVAVELVPVAARRDAVDAVRRRAEVAVGVLPEREGLPGRGRDLRRLIRVARDPEEAVRERGVIRVADLLLYE